MLSTRLLHVHRVVVTEGTLTAAAALLGYTVSAVSQQLSQLEAEAGLALFEKAGRGVRPTAAGLVLAEHAARVLAAVEQAEEALTDVREGRSGRLRVVSFHSAGASLMPLAVAEMRHAMPGVYVLPVVDETEGAVRRLRAGEVDLVVTAEPYGRDEPPEDDLSRVHLLDDEYRVLLNRDHPLARRRTVALGDLADTDWVVTTGGTGYLADITVAACRKAGYTPRVVAEGDEFTVTQGYVAAGLGAALVPLLGLDTIREHIVARPLRQPPEPRHIWATTRPALAGLPAVRRMIAALRTAARSGRLERARPGRGHTPRS